MSESGILIIKFPWELTMAGTADLAVTWQDILYSNVKNLDINK